ncbi:hypothetical protein FGRMN_5335 [Fusarium graminum]|nr:hypothetical protein FGRMN_5335 [Fusarium graminum]
MADVLNPTASQEQCDSTQEGKNIAKMKEDSPCLENMPLEVISHMLSFLPNRTAIRAAMQSCSKLYSAFENRKAYIASCVLFNSMNESVYREAITTLNLKNAEWKGVKAGIETVYRVYSMQERDVLHSQYLTFDRVKEMWRLHKSIAYFARRIPKSLIRKHPVVKYKGAYSITASVRARFQRALYRLDAFVNLMKTTISSLCYDNGGENRDPTDEELEEAHWVHCLRELEEHRMIKAFDCQYSATEIEQLNSICGLLITEIAPCFNTFLQHDIELGAKVPYYITEPESPATMSLIEQGIPFLYDFLTAGSRRVRSKFMDAVKPPINWKSYVSTRPPFPRIDEQLACVIHDEEGEPAKWAHMAIPDFVTRTPFIKDPDAGPECAFAALSRFSGLFLPEEHDAEPGFPPFQCLAWGYVFWDLEMLEKGRLSGINEKDRINNGFTVKMGHPIDSQWNALAKYQKPEATDKLLVSHELKNSLVDNGHTGYFDWEKFESDPETLAAITDDVDATTQVLVDALRTMPMTHVDMTTLMLDLDMADPGHAQ